MTILTGREKPLDFGGGGITGSLDLNGRIIALNCYHPVQGYVTLTSAPTFPDSQRYNPAAVRAYRASLAKLEGFGMQFDSPVVQREVELIGDTTPRIKLTFENGGTAEVTTVANTLSAAQYWEIQGIEPTWGGRLSLKRSAYTQLTEGGVMPFPADHTRLIVKQGTLTIENSALPVSLVLGVAQRDNDFLVEDTNNKTLSFPMKSGKTVQFYTFDESIAEALNRAKHSEAMIRLDQAKTHDDKLLHKRESVSYTGIANSHDLLLKRGLLYSSAMDAGAGAILTDHMLLPLSWNRDAYYLSKAIANGKGSYYWHIAWMFGLAERQGSFWGRCYLANGKIKDKAFQLDQQLYPLLELADYAVAAKKRVEGFRITDYPARVQSVIDALIQIKAPHAELFPTDETPGDDPIALPYHLSSHILFWHTLNRLKQAGLGDWSDLAAQIREAIDQHFIAEHNGRRIYAYATDGAGKHHFYHDANDFPLVLAPWWGFCSADDPVWRATIDFAWSDANKGGCYGGRLGSVHTPGAWPLGDVQELIVAQVTDDPEREAKARANLRAAAFWDGALPEAVDPVTNECISRTWFAWPNAAYACVELGAFMP